jgi:hypothetical protein
MADKLPYKILWKIHNSCPGLLSNQETRQQYNYNGVIPENIHTLPTEEFRRTAEISSGGRVDIFWNDQ